MLVVALFLKVADSGWFSKTINLNHSTATTGALCDCSESQSKACARQGSGRLTTSETTRGKWARGNRSPLPPE